MSRQTSPPLCSRRLSPQLHDEGGDKLGAESLFSPDYCTARERFREAAATAGAELTKLQIDAKGPAGEDLSIDIAWIGGQSPQQVLLHTAGLHGAEGFVGSAIQLSLLKERLSVPDDGALVFVHGINPYGMAWLRRFNEHNVDLNRNFLAADEKFAGAPEGYRKLNEFLNPQTPPQSGEFFLPRALWNIARHGFRNLKQAIAQGQYEYPRGLFFGGRQREQSAEILTDWCQQRLRTAQRIIALDVHTGLGDYAEDVLLVSYAPGAEHYEQLRGLLGRRVSALDPNNEAYQFRGGFLDSLERDIAGPAWTCICQEFGTLIPVQVLYALREENRWHHYGDPQALDHPAKRRLMQAFNPDDTGWRQRCLQRGTELYETVTTSLFEQPSLA